METTHGITSFIDLASPSPARNSSLRRAIYALFRSTKTVRLGSLHSLLDRHAFAKVHTLLLLQGKDRSLQKSSMHSQIMFYLGVVDVLTIVCNSLISGYFTITGSVYCAQPTVTYVSGCFAVGKKHCDF